MITRGPPTLRRRRNLAIVVGLIAVLLAGCTSVVHGKAVPSKQLARENAPLTAEEALGDMATINWCTLLATASFPEGWHAGGKWPGLEYCDFWVNHGKSEIAVRVGHPVDQRRREVAWEATPGKQLPRQLVMERPVRERGGGCARALAFPDHISLSVMASEEAGNPQAKEICRAAEMTVEFVADALVDGYAGHFDEYDDASLAGRIVCRLVPDKLIATARDTPEQPGRSSVSGHECTWPGDGSGPAVILAVDTIHRPDREEVQRVAGRPTRVGPADDGCIVSTDYADFPAYINTDEAISVVVIGAPNPEACSMARKIAKGVWPKLPR